MTLVHIDLREGDFASPAVGSIYFAPSRAVGASGFVAMPSPFTVELVDGVADIELYPTGAGWAWSIHEVVPNGRRITVAVPISGTTINYSELSVVDPRTLEPTGSTLIAAWTAALDQAQDSALASALSATASADSAATAATGAATATTGAATATTKASAASASETASANSATASAGSATSSASSATSATTGAATATTKAGEASTSATAAASSATASAGSATTASTGASTATTKASEASTSATSASGSATSATGSASTATTKAAESAISAATAVTKAVESAASAASALATAAAIPETNDPVVQALIDNALSAVRAALYRAATGEQAVTFAWLGTPHASASVRQLDGITNQTNLATNPSFESVAPGATTVRTNLCTNPGLSGISPWVSTTGSTITLDPATVPPAGASLRVAPSASTNSGARFPFTEGLLGATYTISAWVKIPLGATVQFATDCLTTLVIIAGTGAWERVSRTGIYANPAGGIHFRSTDLTAPLFHIAGLLIEQTDQLRPYFDGSTPDALGFDYGWTGAANASTSTAKASTLEVRRNAVLNPLNGAGIELWGAARLTLSNLPGEGARGTINDAALSGMAQRMQFLSGYRAAIVAGATYAVTASGRTSAGAASMQIMVGFFDAAGTSIVGYGSSVATAVNAATFTRLAAYVAVAPANAVAMDVQIGIAGSGARVIGDTIDVQRVLIEASPLVGAYFDGSTPGAGDFTNAWSGAPSASASVQQGVKVVGVTPSGGPPPIAYRAQDADGTVFVRHVATADASAAGVNVDANLLPTGVLATFRARIRASRSLVVNNRVVGAGAATVQLVANVWQTVTFSAVGFPAGYTGVVVPAGSGVMAGDTVDIDSLGLFVGTYTGDYFDGSTAPKRITEALDARFAPLSVVAALAAETARVLTGTGSPLGVVSAPIGTEYIDLATTTGARRWAKTSRSDALGWVVTEGDTGWRCIAIDPVYGIAAAGGYFGGVNGSALTANNLMVRRIGNRVLFSGINIQPKQDYTGATTARLALCPPGFYSDGNASYCLIRYGNNGGDSGQRLNHLNVPASYAPANAAWFTLTPLVDSNWSGFVAGGAWPRLYGQFWIRGEVLTETPWPTTLPGTPGA